MAENRLLNDGDTAINIVDTRLQSENETSEATPLIVKKSAGTSWYASIFIVVNSILGAGMLNFPLAFHQSGGILSSVLCQLVLVCIMTASLIAFTRISGAHNSTSYQDVIARFCGRKTSYVCSFMVFLYAFGSSVTYIIIIGDQIEMFMQAATPHLIGHDLWYLNRKFLLSVVSVAIILPLCYSKRIDFLKYPSSVGVVAVIYCMILVVVKYFTGIDGAEVGPINTRPESITAVFLVIPTICFSYQCHLNIVPIYTCTKCNHSKYFDWTIVTSVLLCFAIYNLFAIFGYLTFGSAVQADILLNYKPTPDVLAGVIGIAIKMAVSYPLIQFVGRKVIEDLIITSTTTRTTDHDDDVDDKKFDRRERLRRIVITTTWFFSALVISLFVPDIDKVISYLGGLAAIFIFIFPGICCMKYLLRRYGDSKISYWTGIASTAVCISLGGFILGVTTTSNILKNLF